MSEARPIETEALEERARWVWRETLRVHARAPETRIASSLSAVEILTTLFYGGVMRFDPQDPCAPGRDRLIVSKGHGSIAMYPILADLGFFPASELERVCQPGSFLGGIPDPVIPGYETVNGSLGHGPGVACGVALALRRLRSSARVIVLAGDGELHEGAVWEAVMFASHHRLENLTLIVDANGRCMLDDSHRVLDLRPLASRFEAFGWLAEQVDGHDLGALRAALADLRVGAPRVVIAHTLKGRGVPALEASPICHVLGVSPAEVARLTEASDA